MTKFRITKNYICKIIQCINIKLDILYFITVKYNISKKLDNALIRYIITQFIA